MYLRLASNIAEDGLELLILLPPTPKCWDSKCSSSCSVYAVLGIEPMTVHSRQGLYQLYLVFFFAGG